MHHSRILLLALIALTLCGPARAWAAMAPGGPTPQVSRIDVATASGIDAQKTTNLNVRFLDNKGEPVKGATGIVSVHLKSSLLPGIFPALYLPVGPSLARFSLLTKDDGQARFSYLFWEPGTYRIDVRASGGPGRRVTTERDIRVAPNPDQIRASAAMYGSLLVIGLVAGFLAGWARGRKGDPHRVGGAGAVAMRALLVSLLVAPLSSFAPAIKDAHAHSHNMWASERSGDTFVPGKPGQLVGMAHGKDGANVKLEHVEDGLVLFSGYVKAEEDKAKLTWVFPEGNTYRLSVDDSSHEISVPAVKPDRGAQFLSFFVLFGTFIIPAVIGYLVGRRTAARKATAAVAG